jgi:2-enoate reductase
MKFEKLFEPLALGKALIENRVAMAAMSISGLVDSQGGFSQQAIDYYAERAFGGVGLILTGATKVTDIEPRFGSLFVSRETSSSFSDLAEVVHDYGSKIFAQLTPGYGRNLQKKLIDSGFKPVSPSANPSYWRPDVTTRELTIGEIKEIVNAFGNAAEVLKAANVDGIELQGYGGYLLDEFTTAIWNKRKDKYGGPLENRLRFPIEMLNAIKEKAGRDFPVIYRYSVKHYMKGSRKPAIGHEDFVEAGRDIDEGLKMAKLLEKAGFDAIHVNAGCYDSWYWAYPPGYQRHGGLIEMAAKVKKCVKIPVIAVGRIDIPELAEKVLKERKADMVAIGRSLLADPHWLKKVREGKVEEIRPCIGCNDGCMYRIVVERKPLSCSVNPLVGKERLYGVEPLKQPKKLLIAGGGIAGMEAARVATLKGYEVILCEKTQELGGHVIAGSVPDFKQDIRRLLVWYRRQLEKLGVEVRLQAEVTAKLIRDEKPDRIIVATGSKPASLRVLGIEKPIVVSSIDLLLGKKEAGKSVAVIGGGLVGCEISLWLANLGKKIKIVELLADMANGSTFYANRDMMLDLLKEKEVEFIINSKLDEVMDEGISIVDKNLTRRTIRCDTVVLASGLEPERELYESLLGEETEFLVIGDCKEPRKIRNAIWDGYHIANQ